MTFPQALLKSLPGLLFLILVCSGFLALIALPIFGERLGPLACEGGETLVSVSTSYSRPGESGETVQYFCDSASGRQEVAFGTMILAAIKIYLGFFLLVVWPLVALRKVRKGAFEDRMRREGIPATVHIVAAKPTSMRVNEAPMVELELRVEPHGRPAFTKKIFKRVHEYDVPSFQPGCTFPALVDPDRPGKVLFLFDEQASPDVTVNRRTVTMNDLPPEVADMVAKVVGAVGAGAAGGRENFGESNDEVDALRALKTMRDEGLISAEEYAEKKLQIMDRM